jgi:hypothetical protein
MKPVYTNQYDKPVYAVNNAHIHKNKRGFYEVQLNDQYFEITEEMLKALVGATAMPDTMGLSIG